MADIVIPIAEINKLLSVFTSLLTEGNERAMIILGSAKIESLAHDVFVRIAPQVRGLSFGKIVHILFAMGLIDRDTHQCLDSLRRIRNHYAHFPNHCSLDDAEIKTDSEKLIANLQKVHNIQSTLETLRADTQKKWDAAGRGAEGKQWLTTKGDRLKFGILMLGVRLLIAQRLAPTPQAALSLDEFTMRFF